MSQRDAFLGINGRAGVPRRNLVILFAAAHNTGHLGCRSRRRGCGGSSSGFLGGRGRARHAYTDVVAKPQAGAVYVQPGERGARETLLLGTYRSQRLGSTCNCRWKDQYVTGPSASCSRCGESTYKSSREKLPYCLEILSQLSPEATL